MPKFGTNSKNRLATAHPDLQRLFEEVVKFFDCAILVGHRQEVDQEYAYRSGASKLQWPNSLHNKQPSLAVDVAPWPIDWDDYDRFYFFAGFVMGTAVRMGIDLRWGGDWDRDTEVKDNKFNDLVHFELIGVKT